MKGRQEREPALYDDIGVGYRRYRTPDPRIEQRLRAALGPARRVLNVGAGAGSYEPVDRQVVAVEPSIEMIRQRPCRSGPAVRGVAEQLPFRDESFDAAMAVLTVHHWRDPMNGLIELRRVTAGPIVVLTFDNDIHANQWLVTEYLPSMVDLDSDDPTPAAIADILGGGVVEVVPVPHDCVDGFCHAWWRRPEAYLDPQVRAGISGIARLPADVVDAAMSKLADDLAQGVWHRAHGDLLSLEEVDAGYRLVVANS